MKNIVFYSAITGLIIGLTACATADQQDKPEGITAYQDDPRLGEEVSKICFSSSIDGFSNNSDRTVVLDKGVNDKYMVEVFGPCQPLRNAMSIALDSMGGCLTRGDSLIVSDSIGMPMGRGDPFGVERCTINSMYKWNSKAVKMDMDAVQ